MNCRIPFGNNGFIFQAAFCGKHLFKTINQNQRRVITPPFLRPALSRYAATVICRCNPCFIMLIEAMAQGVEIGRQLVADVLQLLPQ